MPIASGLSSQIGQVAETVYGTRVVSTRFLEFKSESLEYPIDRNESEALRAGQQVLRSDRWNPGKKTPGGDVVYELANKGFGLPLKYAFGSVATAQPSVGTDPTVYEHTLTLGDLSALQRTVQLGETDTGGTTRVFEFTGVCTASWQLAQSLDGPLMFTESVVAQDCSLDTQALASASYPASQTLFWWNNLVMTIGGSPYDVSTTTLKCDNGLKDDRFFVGATTRKHPLQAKRRMLTLDATGEFNDMTQINRLTSTSTFPVTLFWTGGIISNAFHYALEVTLPACRFDGDRPKVGGPDVIAQPIKLAVLDGGSGAISAVYRTTDTTP
jgi:hypothetical protein